MAKTNTCPSRTTVVGQSEPSSDRPATVLCAKIDCGPDAAATDHEEIAHSSSKLPLGHRIVNLIAILVPPCGLILAMALAWGWGFDWLHLGLFLGMYIISGLGITIGYHRFFAHRAFQTSRLVQAILGVFGSMAVEGSILQWVATHRLHHQHSDKDDDPHSPHLHGQGFLNMTRGLWRAHIGWIFEPCYSRLWEYVPDLRADRLIRVLSALFPLWVGVGLLVPMLIAGIITQSWTGALLGLIWGGLVRVFIVHHITWSINSVCHIWGARPFRTHDESRNNPIFGVLAFGEGWHNNHHAFPTSARHGLRWWQIDISYLIIASMARVGLVWNVRVPAPARIASKRD